MHWIRKSILLLHVLDNNTLICYQFDYNFILLKIYYIISKSSIKNIIVIIQILNTIKYFYIHYIIHSYEPLYTIHHQPNTKA